MTERLDALLVHAYMYKYDSPWPKSSLRGHMQVSAASELYRQGRVNKIFIAGGKVWGEGYPPLSEVMADELKRKHIPSEDIIVKSGAMDTPQEIDLFLQEANKRGWSEIGDLANESHQNRIQQIYKRRQRQVQSMSSELILEDCRGKHITNFLKRFRRSALERRFRLRNKLIGMVYLLRLEKITSVLAARSRNKKFTPSFDK